jgi:hypothetical protein
LFFFGGGSPSRINALSCSSGVVHSRTREHINDAGV